MKARLILLDTPIIVSDEKIKENDWFYTECLDNIFQATNFPLSATDAKKIIAGIPNLPSIDFNGLEEKFGIVDIEKLALIHYPNNTTLFNNTQQKLHRVIWIDGFKTAQSLNEKKYSLEDMYEFQKFVDRTKPSYKKQQEFIQSLSQPKIFDIEIEMKRERLYTNDGLDYEGDLNPKITNKKIKIIKVLKTKH